MDIVVLISTVSAIVKVVVTLIDKFIFPGQQHQLKSIIVSMALCFMFQLNLFGSIATVEKLYGIIASGFIVAFGSNIANEVHNAIKKIPGPND